MHPCGGREVVSHKSGSAVHREIVQTFLVGADGGSVLVTYGKEQEKHRGMSRF